MKVFMYIDDIFDLGPTAVALGNFDGVHLGHQALIKSMVSYAGERGLTPVVFTFLNHPMNVITGKQAVKNIQTIYEKTEAIEALGVEYLVTAIFDENVMKLPPEDFAALYLRDALNCKTAFCGFNYSFGYKGQGSPALLKLYGEKMGFEVNVLHAVSVDGQTVSSTLIRGFIDKGDMESYLKYTGRLYSIDGKVMKGQHLGTRMGFPTVNLNLSNEMALPANGVYVTKTYVNHKRYDSITNVGNKPTVGTFGKNAETHIFGFSGDLYGQSVRVEFIKMTRPERVFASIDELSAQIQRDCLEAREYHENHRK